MITFGERATQMGLIPGPYGTYEYYDRLSCVLYRTLHTAQTNAEDPDGPKFPETDGYEIPHVALFTKPPGENQTYRYAGIVSRVYRFIGNEVLNEHIRQSVRDVGMPILRESTLLSGFLSQMRHEIVISNSVKHEFGDVLPIIVVGNSYDGMLAQTLQFGLEMPQNGNTYRFAFELGKVKQIHVAGASTTVTAAIEDYHEIFQGSIVDIINASFSTILTEEQVFATLDVIESIGKKRRDRIAAILSEIKPKEQQLPSAWHVFLAIVRYSSLEPNINAKALLESAAESVLVIPPRIERVMRELSRRE